MNRYKNLHRIRQLDPEQDRHEIYRTAILVEFHGMWEALTGLQLAFYSTYGVPAIARQLDHAGELIAHPRKRALDTALLLLELVDHGFSHPQGQQVVRRLERIHGRYEIDNADYLYVLGALVVVPTRWLERYGWRQPCCHERAAAYWFWRALGRQLGVRDIPPTYQAFEQWLDAFERDHLRLSAAGRRLMQASKALLVGRFPRPLAPVAGALADALLHERLQGAVGISAPPRPIRVALHRTLKMRARLLGLRLLPARREPVEAQGHAAASLSPRSIPAAPIGWPTWGRPTLRFRCGNPRTWRSRTASEANRQIRRLVRSVQAVLPSAVCAAQVGCRIQGDRHSPVW